MRYAGMRIVSTRQMMTVHSDCDPVFEKIVRYRMAPSRTMRQMTWHLCEEV
jgi:hypothetical protein